MVVLSYSKARFETGRSIDEELNPTFFLAEERVIQYFCVYGKGVQEVIPRQSGWILECAFQNDTTRNFRGANYILWRGRTKKDTIVWFLKWEERSSAMNIRTRGIRSWHKAISQHPPWNAARLLHLVSSSISRPLNIPTMPALPQHQSVFRITKNDNGSNSAQYRTKTRNRQSISCAACKTRKSVLPWPPFPWVHGWLCTHLYRLKCDRQTPCASCSKRGDDASCTYTNSPRMSAKSDPALPKPNFACRNRRKWSLLWWNQTKSSRKMYLPFPPRHPREQMISNWRLLGFWAYHRIPHLRDRTCARLTLKQTIEALPIGLQYLIMSVPEILREGSLMKSRFETFRASLSLPWNHTLIL